MQPTFPNDDDAVQRRFDFHRRRADASLKAMREARRPGKFRSYPQPSAPPAKLLVEQMLRQTMPIGPGPEAAALALLVNGRNPS